MQALLFQRIEIDGINYYQLFRDDPNFDKDSLFADYEHRDTKDYFYIDADSNVSVPDPARLNIYYSDENGNLKVLEDENKFVSVFEAFQKKYHTVIIQMTPSDKIINEIGKKVMFQNDTIRYLVKQIYKNQATIGSSLPYELKTYQKNNILFYGDFGSGKRTIIENIEKHLDIPYVDVTLSSNIQDVTKKIIQMLLKKSEDNPALASRGVVFIRDNFDELYKKTGENAFNIIKYLSTVGKVEYEGNIVDFNTITFVVLYNHEIGCDEEEINRVQDATNCDFAVCTRNLTNEEKKMVLFSSNGRLYQYEKYLNQFGKRLIINDDSLEEIIELCKEFGLGMAPINAVIDDIIKYITYNEMNDVYIDEDCVVNTVMKILASYRRDYPTKNEEEIDDDYFFEKQVDEILTRVKKKVIGQDRFARMLIFQLLTNLRAANNNSLDSPKARIMNIMLRGGTGSGKTYLVETVLKNMGVPYFTANATDYTGTGWIGSSVDEMLTGLVEAAGGDIEKAQRGVLFIDEICKKATSSDKFNEGPGKGLVQEALYKLAEGSIIMITITENGKDKKVPFDTSRLTIVLAGAFEGLEDIRNKRIGLGKCGFGSWDTRGKDLSFTIKDYIDYGMHEQFMRRVNEIIELDVLSKEDLIDVMKNSADSSLTAWKAVFKDIGVELEYTDDFYEAMAEKSIELKQGVESIKNTMVKILQSINYQDIRPSQVEKIILNGETIKDSSKAVFIARGHQKKK